METLKPKQIKPAQGLYPGKAPIDGLKAVGVNCLYADLSSIPDEYLYLNMEVDNLDDGTKNRLTSISPKTWEVGDLYTADEKEKLAGVDENADNTNFTARSVTELNDVSDAGSGAIVTTDERSKHLSDAKCFFSDTDPSTISPPTSGYYQGTYNDKIWIKNSNGVVNYWDYESGFKGPVDTSDSPSSTDNGVWYRAKTTGTYTNFGGVAANAGDRIECYNDGTTVSWNVKDDSGSGDIVLTSDGDADGNKWKNLPQGIDTKDSVNYGQVANYPYAADSLTGTDTKTREIRQAFKDIVIFGTKDAAYTYSFVYVARNAGYWRVSMYSKKISDGTTTKVAQLYTTISPEDGDKVTIHKLSEYGGSGISGYIAINWSDITDGASYTDMYEANGFAFDDSIWDKTATKYFKNYDVDGNFDIGTKQIKNVVAGTEDTDGVNIGQLNGEVDPIKLDILDLEDITDKSFSKYYGYDAETKVTDGTDIYTSTPRDDPFAGWASDYIVQAGMSFNASRSGSIKRVSGSTEWGYIKFFLRTSLSSPNVAESLLIKVANPSVLEIPETEFAWLDPATGNLLTVTEALLGGAGAVYYFGYMTFQADGVTPSACGETTYTGTNNLHWNGNSFYRSATHDEFTWYTQATPINRAFDLLQWTGIELLYHLKELDGLNIPDTSVRINLPDKYNAIVGMPFELFYTGIIETTDINKYNIVVTCDIGKDYLDRFYLSAVSSDIGTHSFKISVRNDANEVINEATTSIVVKAKVNNPASQINILPVGDSLCNADTDWGGLLGAMIVDGTDSLLSAITNIDLIGDFGTGKKKYVGFGGQQFYQYNEEQAEDPNTQDTWITAAGHDKTEADDQESIWQDSNGNQWQLESVNGDKLLMKHYNQNAAMPTPSGTLTHVANAVHTTDISYTAVDYLDRNPFWDDANSKVDFHSWFADRYPTKESAGEKIDAVAVLLGWNGTAPYSKEYTDNLTLYNDAKTFIDNVFASYPNAIIFLMGLNMPSLNGGMGASYGATGTYSDTWGMMVSVIGINLTYQKIADEYVAAGKDVQFIHISGQFDSVHNMQDSLQPVNVRNSTTKLLGTNGVHPASEGYLQIADAALRYVVAKFCQ